MAGLRLEVARDTNRHVKKTLPPSLSGFAGQAEIKYYVKVTVQRPAFYKENFRAVRASLPSLALQQAKSLQQADFQFFPIEPPRGPKNSRESYARRQHQFAPAIDPLGKAGLLRRISTATKANNDALPPSIAFEGRLPDPPIITCNEPLPLRLLVTKLNESHAHIYLKLIEIVLVSNTITRAHELERSDTGSFVLLSRSNLQVPLRPSENDQNGKGVEIDAALWNHVPLPNTVAPTFDTCNISRNYLLDIKLGLSWGSGSQVYVSSSGDLLSEYFIPRLFSISEGTGVQSHYRRRLANCPLSTLPRVPPFQPNNLDGSCLSFWQSTNRAYSPSSWSEPFACLYKSILALPLRKSC